MRAAEGRCFHLRASLSASDCLGVPASSGAPPLGRLHLSASDCLLHQVLRHRKFGFRAVVFGWDARPQIDVSQWDGVVGLPSGPSQPFYRMVPDDGDCYSLLGGPRGVRYVAQVIATGCVSDCH